MKTTFFLLAMLFLLCPLAAVGQAAVGGSINSQPQIVEFTDHPQHAEARGMACEHPLVGLHADTYTYAQGERPLWEFGPVSEPVPLGDVAREYRKQKLGAKKSEKIIEKQGS